MCGRFTNSQKREELERSLLLAMIEGEVKPRYNVAPSQSVLVVRLQDNQRKGEFLQWGLIPHWSKPDAPTRPMVNARAETVLDKPSFRDSFRKRRCLVPADGYYEWKTEGKLKRPFYFYTPGFTLFCFAGVWDTWTDSTGVSRDTFCMLTTRPNTLCATVHDRMPVLLTTQESWAQWLNPTADPAALAALFVPQPDSALRCHEVSTAVNKPAHDTADLIRPLSA